MFNLTEEKTASYSRATKATPFEYPKADPRTLARIYLVIDNAAREAGFPGLLPLGAAVLDLHDQLEPTEFRRALKSAFPAVDGAVLEVAAMLARLSRPVSALEVNDGQ